MTEFDLARSDEILGLPTAGPKAVRGGTLRTTSYLVSTGAVAVASIFLLRHLGVTDFGRYVTVMSLVAVVAALSDAGLTMVGQREYVLLPTKQGRRTLVADVLGIRLLITPVGVVLATLFALAAGYTDAMTLGALIAGLGLLLGNGAKTFTLPLTASLRLGSAAAVQLGQSLTIVAGMAVLIAAGAGLLPFFTVQVAAGLVSLVLAAILVGPTYRVAPRTAWREWRPLLSEAAPLGLAIVVNMLYLRALVVLTSVLASGFETGLFATSYRVLEITVGVSAVMVSAAFPILAHAGPRDEPRLAYVLQRLLEVSMLVAVALVLLLAIGAGPIIDIIGGHAYQDAGPVLRIQAFALLGAFAGGVWTAGLVGIRRQSALILTNVIALIAVLVLGGAFVPWLGAKGAAIAAVLGEAALALAVLVMLVRARPALLPRFGFALRLAAAALLGLACVLIPGLPLLARAVLAAAVYSVAAYALGAVPAEVLDAFRHRRRT
jgi:O-antigen/teichoic acid export membrane protein